MTFFDTNAPRRRLIAGGFTDEQADTAVSVAADVAGQTLATKADLRDLEQSLTIKLSAIVGTMLALAVAILSLAGP